MPEGSNVRFTTSALEMLPEGFLACGSREGQVVLWRAGVGTAHALDGSFDTTFLLGFDSCGSCFYPSNAIFAQRGSICTPTTNNILDNHLNQLFY